MCGRVCACVWRGRGCHHPGEPMAHPRDKHSRSLHPWQGWLGTRRLGALQRLSNESRLNRARVDETARLQASAHTHTHTTLPDAPAPALSALSPSSALSLSPALVPPSALALTSACTASRLLASSCSRSTCTCSSAHAKGAAKCMHSLSPSDGRRGRAVRQLSTGSGRQLHLRSSTAQAQAGSGKLLATPACYCERLKPTSSHA